MPEKEKKQKSNNIPKSHSRKIEKVTPPISLKKISQKKVKEDGVKETNLNGKENEQETSWVDGLQLVVETEFDSTIKDLVDADIVGFQLNTNIDQWDMSNVVSEVDREKETTYFTMDDARVVGVDGVHNIDFDGTASYDPEKEKIDEISEEEFLEIERRKYNEIKRNRKEYGIYCTSCRNTLRCKNCSGKGRRGLFRRKCKVCNGNGRCQICRADFELGCPKCGKLISGYSLSCRFCGRMFRCEKCLEPLPLMATRCISCKKEYLCKFCKQKVPVNKRRECPKCGQELDEITFSR